MKKYIPIIVSILIILPLFSIAHEGHGLVENGPAHYIFSIDHAWPLIAVVALVIFLVRKRILKMT